MDAFLIILLVILMLAFLSGRTARSVKRKCKENLLIELEQSYSTIEKLIKYGEKSALSNTPLLDCLKDNYEEAQKQGLLRVRLRNGLDLLLFARFFIVELKKDIEFKNKEHLLKNVEFQLEKVTKLFMLYFVSERKDNFYYHY